MSRSLSTSFHDKLKSGATPVAYIAITSMAGVRIYAGRTLGEEFSGRPILYGSGYRYGDPIVYGQGSNVLSREGLLLSHGNIGRALQVTAQSRSSSGANNRIQNLMFTLNDADQSLRQRFSVEPILGSPITMRYGFDDVTYTDHLTLYSGSIIKTTVSETSISVDTRGT